MEHTGAGHMVGSAVVEGALAGDVFRARPCTAIHPRPSAAVDASALLHSTAARLRVPKRGWVGNTGEHRLSGGDISPFWLPKCYSSMARTRPLADALLQRPLAGIETPLKQGFAGALRCVAAAKDTATNHGAAGIAAGELAMGMAVVPASPA